MSTPGVFSVADAREILATVRQIRASGLLTRSGFSPGPTITPGYHYVKNVSGEEIPAYACMQMTGTSEVGKQNYVSVDQPADDTGAAGGFVFNGPSAIDIDGLGVGFAGPIVRALGDGSTATAGDKWDPVASSWSITDGGSLFNIIGDDDVDTNVVKIQYAGSGGGGATLVHGVAPPGGIAAKSGSTMGSATCDVYESSVLGVLTDSGTNATFWNPSAGAIAANAPIAAMENDAGLLVILFENCT